MQEISLFKIYGTERRMLKKELHSLKSYVKNFWRNEQIEDDMCFFYNCRPQDKEQSKKLYEKAVKEIEELEQKLNEKI